MKPLKGELIVTITGNIFWRIHLPGGVVILSGNRYASEKTAIKSAKRFAARCNIELEVDRETH